jgi:hypothetical protein
MKNLILTVVTLLSLNYSFGQTANIAVCSSKSVLIQGKEKGIFEIKMPDDVSKEAVDKYAQYYVNAFKVNFDTKSHVVTINMVDNSSSNRRVILRFLSANQIQNVIVEGKSYPVSDFYEVFLK